MLGWRDALGGELHAPGLKFRHQFEHFHEPGHRRAFDEGPPVGNELHQSDPFKDLERLSQGRTGNIELFRQCRFVQLFAVFVGAGGDVLLNF